MADGADPSSTCSRDEPTDLLEALPDDRLRDIRDFPVYCPHIAEPVIGRRIRADPLALLHKRFAFVADNDGGYVG
jgi:hypothetical protein